MYDNCVDTLHKVERKFWYNTIMYIYRIVYLNLTKSLGVKARLWIRT